MASGLAPAALFSSKTQLRLDDAAWDPALGQVESVMSQAVTEQAGPLLAPMIHEHLGAGGKRLRARLALAAGEALGASRSPNVLWAASCELMHNATLVHDDVQDGDTIRRGKPTVWCQHGVAQAINVGDLLLMLPYALVTRPEFDPTAASRLTRALGRYIMTVIVGQAAECAMTADKDGTLSGYLEMVRGKTAALFELPVFGAAIVAQYTQERAQTLAQGFSSLGVLFQLQDDVIDLFGDKGRNQMGADIYEGKMSALVLKHLSLCPEDSAWLMAILRAPRENTLAKDVARVKERFVASGALTCVLETIVSEAHSAHRLCDKKLRPLLLQLTERILAPIASLMDESLPAESLQFNQDLS